MVSDTCSFLKLSLLPLTNELVRSLYLFSRSMYDPRNLSYEPCFLCTGFFMRIVYLSFYIQYELTRLVSPITVDTVRGWSYIFSLSPHIALLVG